MAINNTFDQLDGIDQSEREAAEARALEAGTRIVDGRAEAREEAYRKAAEADKEDVRYAGKYRSADELEKAYLELQRKLGEKSSESSETDEASDEDTSDDEEEQEESSEQNDDAEEEGDEEEESQVLDALVAANQEFTDGGKLSDETIEKLSQLDSRELVETWAQYIRSQQEQAQQAQLTEEQIASIRQVAGGDEAYKEMLGWASENLSPDEIAAYDAVMNGSDFGAMYWAAQGLKARFGAEAGYEGRTYTGTRAPKPEPGFRSQAELARAISDPRYKDDPAYRIEVQEKLARSGNLL